MSRSSRPARSRSSRAAPERRGLGQVDLRQPFHFADAGRVVDVWPRRLPCWTRRCSPVTKAILLAMRDLLDAGIRRLLVLPTTPFGLLTTAKRKRQPPRHVHRPGHDPRSPHPSPESGLSETFAPRTRGRWVLHTRTYLGVADDLAPDLHQRTDEVDGEAERALWKAKLVHRGDAGGSWLRKRAPSGDHSRARIRRIADQKGESDVCARGRASAFRPTRPQNSLGSLPRGTRPGSTTSRPSKCLRARLGCPVSKPARL